ncbi:hypothetical protein KFE98_20105 [bacterium SCSIO 12741]|nr:hypothetical protein KFE98_20105 [bacterium SCSIO 12741]
MRMSAFSIGFLLLLMAFVSSSVSAQDTLNEDELLALIERFATVKDMPYICEQPGRSPRGCGDPVIWEAVQQKEAIIPYLLDHLDDTTTTPAPVPYFGSNYTVADISYAVFSTIVWDLPTLDMAEDPEKPEKRNGIWGYWNYTRRSLQNRKDFKQRVIDWYKEHEDSLVWINSPDINICECLFDHPNKGHYEVQKYLTQFKARVVESAKHEDLPNHRLVKLEVLSVIQYDPAEGENARLLNQKRQFIWVVETGTPVLFEGGEYRVRIPSMEGEYYRVDPKEVRNLGS